MTRSRARSGAWARSVAVGVAAALALWFRLPAPARDTLWAEDGAYFLSGAERHGIGQLFLPYAGYLQFVPRVIAAVVVRFPVATWGYGMTAGACLVSGAVAVLVFVSAASVVPRVVPRVLLAATTVLLPLGPRDVFGNPTNLHTVLLWGLFWLLFATPIRTRTAVVLSVVGLTFALSEIQAVFLVPLVAWRLFRGRSRIVAIGPAVGIVWQLLATVVAPRSADTNAHLGVASVAMGYLVNGIVPLATPIDGVGAAVASGGGVVAAVVVLVAVVGTVLLWRRMSVPVRVAVTSALVLGPLVYAASVTVNPAPYYDYAAMSRAQLEHLWLTRYGVAPGMLFVAVVVLLAATLPRVRVRVRARIPVRVPGVASVAVLVLVATCLTVFFVPSWTRRSDGPRWSTSVAAAAASCERTGRASVLVPETIGWHVPVPCARLVPARSR